MELSVKKINRAMESFFVKENYKYYPSHFGFDYDSDPDYVYMLVEAHYIIRIPKHIMPEYEEIKNKGSVNVDLPLENAIVKLTKMDLIDFHYIGDGILSTDGPEVAIFKSDDGDIKSIQKRFFKEYYNQLLTKTGFPENITFTGHKQSNYPLIMWEDDEAIAEFCPIVASK